MSEPEAYTERGSFDLRLAAEPFVLDGGDQNQLIAGAHFPIHFGGMSVALNNSGGVTAVVSVDDSPDGTTWTPVLFSTDTLSNLLNITIVGRGQQQILFESIQRYVRFRLAENVEGGVQGRWHQFVPRARKSVEALY
jgi:hypothetical protein